MPSIRAVLGIVVLTASCLLPVSVTAQSVRSQDPRTADEIERIIQERSLASATVAQVDEGVPTLIFGVHGREALVAQPKLASPEQIQAASLAVAERLIKAPGFVSSSIEFKAAPAVKAGLTFNTTLNATIEGIPVRDREIHVTIGAETGELLMLRNTLPLAEPAATTPQVTAAEVEQMARTNISVSTTMDESATLVFIPFGRDLKLAYEIVLKEEGHTWQLRYDATTGELLAKRDLIVYCAMPDEQAPESPQAKVEGRVTGMVYDKSPFDTLSTQPLPFVKIRANGSVVYADKDGKWSITDPTYPLAVTTWLESQYFKVNRLDGAAGVLQDSIRTGALNLHWAATKAQHSERTAYYGAHKVQQHLLTFDPGFTLLKDKITINVNYNDQCNAFYNPGDRTLNFFQESSQCANTGEIVDVVFHEYGHHYHHMRYQWAGTDVKSRSLGEAVADIVSNALRDDPVIGDGFMGEGTMLRTSRNTKKWPSGVTTDPHTTGLILTGAIWDLRTALGWGITEKLFHEALKLAPDATSTEESEDAALEAFLEVLMAMLFVDDNDNNLSNGTPNASAILAAFDAHGIGLSNMLKLDMQHIPDQDTVAVGYPIKVTAVYEAQLGDVQRDSLKVYYSVNNGPFASAQLSHQGETRYWGSIPKVPAGSIVKYYITGKTNFENATTVRYPRGTTTHSFYVGYKQRFLDDAESESDALFEVAGDNATKGIWERAIPAQTLWWTDNSTVQHDTDHTENGMYCYVTGNGNAATSSTDPIEDALTNGKTTLQTGSISIPGVQKPLSLRFWYYYRTEALWVGTKNTFRVQISTNNGSSWRTIFTTAEKAKAWTSTIVNPNLPLGDLNNVKIRFVAQAAQGTLVEAGIDDIELLEPLQASGPASVEAEGSVAGLAISSIYPNPANGRRITVSYELPRTGIAQLQLKNVMGSTVWMSNGELKPAGPHSEEINVSDLVSGVYWLQLVTGDGIEIKQVHILK